MTDQGRKKAGIFSKAEFHCLNPTTYFISLPKKLRIDYRIFWPLWGVLLYGIFCFLSHSNSDRIENEYILPLIVVGAGVWMAFAANFCAIWLDRFLRDIHLLCYQPDDCRSRMMEYIDCVFSLKKHLFHGVFWFLFLEILTYWSSAGYTREYAWYAGRWGHLPFMINWGITAYMIGGGAYIVFKTMLIPQKLAKENIKLNLHAYKKSPIRNLSTIFLSQSFLVFGAALFAVLGVVYSPNKEQGGFVFLYVMFLWISVVYFIWTQWGIHKILIKGKIVILDRLAEKFEEELARIRGLKKTDEDTENRATRILGLRREVISFPDWTINLGNLSAIASLPITGSLTLIYNHWSEILTYLRLS